MESVEWSTAVALGMRNNDGGAKWRSKLCRTVAAEDGMDERSVIGRQPKEAQQMKFKKKVENLIRVYTSVQSHFEICFCCLVAPML